MDRNTYRTPPQLFAAMNAEFDFKIDVAASAENKLCEKYFDKEIDSLSMPWASTLESGDYAWCNPPYSDIGPWVTKATEQAKLGIGCVMLVMADTSVKWFADAIGTCQEVRFITGGRISFLNPDTGKPAAGNNKGSMFLIWHPFGRGKAQYSAMDRDETLSYGEILLDEWQF